MYSFLGYLLECIVLTIEYKEACGGPWFWPWPLLYHIRLRRSRRMPAVEPVIRSSGRTVYSIYDYGNYHGADHSQCDDPPVWKLLVGLQPQAI